MNTIERLLKDRLDAIQRGDKTLGREIYHQLVNTHGLNPEDIDAGKVPTAPAAPAPEAAKPEEAPVVDAPVEQVVPPKPEPRTKPVPPADEPEPPDEKPSED